MANVYAVKSGNWSDTTVWNTGSLPTSADDVYSNNYTVTIDIDVNVNTIRGYGAYNGGMFTISSSRTVACSGGFFIGSYGFNIVQALGRVVNLVGNITSGNASNGRSVTLGGTLGTLNITGNITSNNMTGLLAEGVYGVTINITGNLYAGSHVYGYALDLTNTSHNVYITGNLYSSLSANAVTNLGNGTIIEHTGACYAADGFPAINTSNSAVNIKVTGPFYTSTNGTHGIMSPNWKWMPTLSPTFYQTRNASSSIRTLYTADYVGGNPSTSNVRSGTVYGPSSELTGTCAVPAASSVAFGTPVDNTTGTAVLTAANVRAAVGLASANLDTQLTPLTNLDATVSSRSTYAGSDTSGTTTLLSRLSSTRAGNLDSLDATVSSRLAASSYIAPPSAASNASAVRTELTTEINRIDTTISSRLAPSGTLARVTLVDTTTALTNSPDVPTEAEIAAQVRTELSPELSRVSNSATVQNVAEIVEGALQTLA